MKPLLVPLLLTALCASACVEPVTTTDAALPVLLTSRVWAGGELFVRSTLFDSSTIVLGNGQPLATRRVDDSTMAARVPQMNGALTIRIPSRPVAGDLGVVRVHGVRDVRYGPWIAGYILPRAVASPIPWFLANGESTLVQVDLRYNHATRYPRSMHDPDCMRGPGPTPDPDIVILGASQPNNPCRWQLWRIGPTPQLLPDTAIGTERLAAMLTPSAWVIGAHHQICLLRFGQPYWCEGHEEMNGIRFSPRGDRAFMYNGTSGAGAPIFDAVGGGIAYWIPDASAGGGGGFSTEGDTLFFAAQTDPGTLIVLDAATGARYREIPLTGWPQDALVDPDRPFVYVLVWRREAGALGPGAFAYRPWLEVIDRTAFTTAAIINPDSVSGGGSLRICDWTFCDNRLIVDPRERVLYVVGPATRIFHARGPSVIARFDLMP